MSATIVAAPPTVRGVEPKRALSLGRDVLTTEAAAISALSDRLGAPFLAAARTLFECRGRVVVTGIGKSGHIARKIAATLASTGTPGTPYPNVEVGVSPSDPTAVIVKNTTPPTADTAVRVTASAGSPVRSDFGVVTLKADPNGVASVTLLAIDASAPIP